MYIFGVLCLNISGGAGTLAGCVRGSVLGGFSGVILSIRASIYRNPGDYSVLW